MINKLHEHSIDDLFRVRLNEGEQHIEYRESDWEAMEKRLDGPGATIYRIRLYAAAAVVMLAIAGSWLFFYPPKNDDQPANRMALKRQFVPVNPPGLSKSKIPEMASNQTDKSQKTGTYSSMNSTTIPVAEHNAGQVNGYHIINAVSDTRTARLNAAGAPPMALAALTVDEVPGTGVRFAPQPTVYKNRGRRFNDYGWSDLSVGLIASTDLNGAGSFQQAAIGDNIGVMLTMHVIGNWNVTTGAMYAKKPYNVPFSQYPAAGTYPFMGQPNRVHADYRMLDLPININYIVSNGRDSRVLVDAGISSYMMLQEKYYYEYGVLDNETKELSVNDHDNQWLSIVNFGITYQKRLGSNLSIDFEPYIKFPVNRIGYGQVRLQSLGLALKLNWGVPEI